ncbi:hypothetical protein M768_00050 [Cellulosimicrobium cellulans F16]|uniref:Lipoprotein LpqB beta-propeller domain-containing protein n=1 Tax=Cellulosimicrobium cellulans F16 TaxID=1350482 RepID=A0A0M0FDB9_CELCE|nr:hypothetical protein [Cellulosimicrobium cellulans]KON75600.1 hypothetical protein M768_00050 [Cellulosimicrobium cellulans F16]
MVQFTDPQIEVSSPASVSDASPAATERVKLLQELEWSVEDDPYHSAEPATIGPDCSLIGTSHESTGSNFADFSMSVGSLDVDGFSRISEPQGEGGPWQPLSIVRQGDSVAWIETTSTNLEWFDWRVLRGSLEERSAHEITNSIDFFGSDDPPKIVDFDPRLSVSAEQVVWNTSRPGSRTPLLVGISGSVESPREIVEGVSVHAASEDAIYYVMPGSSSSTVLRLPDGASTPEKVLEVTDDRKILALAVDDDRIAFTVASTTDDEGTPQHNAQIYVVDLASKSARLVQTASDGLGNLAMADGALAFGAGSGNGDAGQYLAFFESGELVRLGDSPGYSHVGATGDLIAWSRITDSGSGIVIGRLRS